MAEEIRIDKYLWAIRVFKTRSEAAEAVKSCRVTVNGSTVKPSREIRIGDVISVRKAMVTYSYKVLECIHNRLPARDVPNVCLDITPEEEKAKLNVPKETLFIFRDRGTGRPTKKERREIDAAMEMLSEDEWD